MLAGTLEIQLMANMARLQKDMDDAKRAVGGAMDSINSAVGMASKALALLGVAATVDHFKGMVMGAIEAQAELKRLSERTGTTVETLSGLKGVAKLSGTDMESVATGIQKLSKAMVEAKDGTGKQAMAFSALGITAKDAGKNLDDPGQMMLLIAKRLGGFKDGASKTAVMMELFGKAGANLLPMLKELAEKGELNAKVTDAQGAEAKKFEQIMVQWDGRWKAFYGTIATAILPVLNDLFGSLVAGGGVAKTFTTYIKELSESGKLREWAETAKRGFDLTVAAIKPAAEITAVYLALTQGVPIIVGAATAALGSMQMTYALLKLEMAQGMTVMQLMNTQLIAGTTVAAAFGTAAGALKSSLGLLFAAFAGWQIGAYLRDNFAEARIAGAAFVGVMLTGWENIKYAGTMVWEAIKFAFNATISGMKGEYGAFLGVMGKGLSMVGAIESGAKVTAYADDLKAAVAAQKSFSAQTTDITAAHKKELAAIDDNIVGMIAYELAADGAAKGAKKAATESKAENDLQFGGAEAAYKAFIAMQDGLYKIEENSLRMHLQVLESQHNRALVGDFQYEGMRFKLEMESLQKRIGIRQAELAASNASGNKEKAATYQADIDTLNAQKLNEAFKHGEALYAIEHAIQQEISRIDVEEMKRRGDIVGAFTEEFSGKYTDMMIKAQLDGNVKLQAAIERAWASGLNSAKFDQTKVEFETQMADMTSALEKVRDAAANDGGLAAAIDAQGIADSVAGQALPALQALQQSMLAAATAAGDLGRIKIAIDFGKSIDAQTTKMRDFATDIGAAWRKAGEDIASSMEKAFGGAGKDMGALLKIVTSGVANQTAIDAKYSEAKKKQGADLAALERRYNTESAANTLDMYGDMAGATKNFFNEKSGAYQAFAAIEKAMHIASLVMNAEKIISNLATIPAAIAAGASQMFAQSGWAGFIGVAAMLAVMASLGFGGGGGGANVDIAKERQKAQGTGTVLGDETAKSESIAHSIDILSSNSNIALTYSQGMLSALHSIKDNIAGMAAFVSQSTGLRGTTADQLGLGVGSERSFLGFSSDSTELVDSGIVFDRIQTAADAAANAAASEQYSRDLANYAAAVRNEDVSRYAGMPAQPTMQTSSQTVGSVLSGNIAARGYSDLHSESSSFWGLFSDANDSTQFKDLGDDLKTQFVKTVQSLYTGVMSAAGALGKDSSLWENVLKNVSFADAGLDRISLKGLSGADVEKELQAAFSKLGDTMAKAVMPELASFQRVGEGMFETLVRVSNGVESAQFALEKFGFTAIDFNDVMAKQGDVGAEIVRQTIEMNEKLSDGALSGIGKIVATLDGAASDIADTYSNLLQVRDLFKSVGLSGDAVNVGTVRGGGDLQSLQGGLGDYLDKYFTDAEKATAATARMHEQFDRLGLSMPTTLAGFRALATQLGQDTTEAGQKLFSQMILLSGSFYDMVKSQGAVADATKQATADFNNVIASATQNAIAELRNFAHSITEFSDSLLVDAGKVPSSLGNESVYNRLLTEFNRESGVLTGAISMQEARAQGITVDREGYQALAQQLIQASQTFNGTGSAAFGEDFWNIQRMLNSASVQALSEARETSRDIGMMLNGTTYTGPSVQPINRVRSGGGGKESDDIVSELRSLRAEVANLSVNNSAENNAAIKHMSNVSGTLEDAANGGRPLTTTAA